MEAGDAIDIDNSDYLASQTYHRHQMPADEYYVWEQFKDKDGNPIYPQRPLLRGYDQAGSGNNWQTGRFAGKMIVLGSMMDEAAYPWQIDWYRKRVIRNYGDAYKDRYRVYLNDHAMHVYPSRYLAPNEGSVVGEDHGPTTTQVIRYEGILQQAIRYVSDWAEKGIAPPEESHYMVDDGQVYLPAAVAERHGIQPVVSLACGGMDRVDVKAGETVEFQGGIQAPAGTVVSAEWDYDGQGNYPDKIAFADGKDSQSLLQSHSWSEPGTYFVTLRGISQRKDIVGTNWGKALNIARVRVVVS